ncbi:MAG: hypothetical protein ILO68_02275 [Clostridia bacterium]|nr:hypothetical protein [Clostridia bacterium]
MSNVNEGVRMFNAIANIDETLLGDGSEERGKNESPQPSGQGGAGTPRGRNSLWLWILLASFCVLAVGLTAFLIVRKTASSGSLIGRGTEIESGDSYVVKDLPTLGTKTVRLRAQIGPNALEGLLEKRTEPKEDDCLEIVGQWFSAVYSFDYERAFRLFPDALVDKTVSDYLETHPLSGFGDRDAVIAAMRRTASYFPFGTVSVTFTVTEIEDVTESFRESRSAEKLRAAGLDPSRVTAAFRYGLRDFSALIFDRFVLCQGIPDMVFFEYRGNWYLSPDLLDLLESTFEIALDQKEYVSGTEELVGEVEQIGDGYLMCRGTLLLAEQDAGVSVGDRIEATVNKTGGLAVKEAGGDGSWIQARSLVSARPWQGQEWPYPEHPDSEDPSDPADPAGSGEPSGGEESDDLSVKPYGTVPSAFEKIVGENLLWNARVFGRGILKAEQENMPGEDGRVLHRIVLMDVYGNFVSEYRTELSDAYAPAGMTLTSDGGFLAAFGYREVETEPGIEDGESGTIRSRIVKCAYDGSVQFETDLEDVEWDALTFCCEAFGRYYFFGTCRNPESRKDRGETDAFGVMIGPDGRVLRTCRFGGSEADRLVLAYYSSSDNGFHLTLYTKSEDGDFAGCGVEDGPCEGGTLLLDDDLYRTYASRHGLDNSDALAVVGGRSDGPVLAGDIWDRNLIGSEDSRPTAFLDYGDVCLFVAEHPAGEDEDQTETVYSAFDEKGFLIFRAVVPHP